MNKLVFPPMAVLLSAVVTIFGCTKQELSPTQEFAAVESAAKSTSAQASGNKNNAKNLLLKQMTLEGRTYTFYYNRRGDVNLVQIAGDANYSYHVTYSGSRISLVELVDGGETLATNSNFTYHGNNITGYDYQWLADGPEFKTTFTFEYDNKGRIITQKRTGVTELTITYDAANNVRSWNNILYSSYDNELNPLYYVNNLFAIFVEEPFIWEYAFSQHNLTSIANEYNSANQLVKGRGGYTFSYY